MSENFKKLSFSRLFQRYFVPSFIKTLYFFVKYRAVVSRRSDVQFTPLLTFGKGCQLKAYTVVQTTTGAIRFGDDCALNNFTKVYATNKSITIGNYVRFGPNSTIIGSNRNVASKDTLIIDQGYTERDISIGDDVLIGANAVILSANVGEGAIIGAGAVVTKDVEPYSIVSGIPAKVIGHRK